MFGISFIGPGAESGASLKDLVNVPGLPVPYCKDNLLSDHLLAAAFMQSLHLTVQQHINPETKEGFSCISYYSDDQKDGALTSKEDFGFLATMSAPFVRRLVKIVDKLGPALEIRPRAGEQKEKPTANLEHDPELDALLEGDVYVSEQEALEIISGWPSPKSQTQTELGGFTIFYDMIRLVWVHEWAHALTGHVVLLNDELGLSKLHEFSTERAGGSLYGKFTRSEVLQALEAHADEFATRTCIQGILWGHDPVADIAGPRVDLMDRLLLFNIACCVFAITWALAEKKYSPDDTFRPPLKDLTDDTPGPIYALTRSTHPPAVLRYQNFRGFQREISANYRDAQGATHLSTMVDAYSYGFVLTLGQLSRYFYGLQVMTPMWARTPTEKVLEAYTNHLVDVSVALSPKLMERYYIPTVDPYAEEEPA